MSTPLRRHQPRPVTAWQLEQSVSLWQQLQARLADDTPPDELYMAPPVPPPHVLLERLIDEAIWANRRVAESKALMDRYKARRERAQIRVDAHRDTITRLLEVLGEDGWEGSEGAADMRERPASVIITDIDKVPDELKTTEVVVTPDKISIGAKLKAKQPVAGAELSNPARSLTITPF